MTLWVSRAPLLCTAAALTWIQVLREVERREKAQPGCCQQPWKRAAPSTVRVCSKSRQWHLCLPVGRRLCVPASKNAPGCVHLCICSVFTKGEGLSAFNYSTVKDLTCPFQSLSLHRPWYIIERLFLKKADQRGRLIPPLHGQHR